MRIPQRAVVLVVVALCSTACGGGTGARVAAGRPPPVADRLTPRQAAYAEALVESDRSLDGASIDGATAVVRPGFVDTPNAGPPCTSGRLIRVTVTGSFPSVVTSGPPAVPGRGGRDVPHVTAVVLVGDARTGRRCEQSVRTGPLVHLAGSRSVLPARPPRITMEQVRRFTLTWRYRRYTGSRPSPIPQRSAVRRAGGGRSLGLWDVRAPSIGAPAPWRHVWVVTDVSFATNIDAWALGGRPGAPDVPRRAGWDRRVTLIDADTGALVLGYSG
ncbi:MAG: hypothetical protein FWE71_16775 [Nocardioidaceae bacterium]|nr:hypothetical protein [Nocardioidaceae bacterium]